MLRKLRYALRREKGSDQSFHKQLSVIQSGNSAFAPGGVLVLPGGQSHFHCAKSGEYIAQVNAVGPLGLEYVSSADDPRNRE